MCDCKTYGGCEDCSMEQISLIADPTEKLEAMRSLFSRPVKGMDERRRRSLLASIERASSYIGDNYEGEGEEEDVDDAAVQEFYRVVYNQNSPAKQKNTQQIVAVLVMVILVVVLVMLVLKAMK